MGEVTVLGVGAFSERFSNWSELVEGLRHGRWSTGSALQPHVIARKDRRRIPRPVKIAIEVMSQACDMASLRPDAVATVFSSAMGDMQITDYMCRVLAETPLEISPTRFHNSVHNAPTGYWSIATRAHAPSNAVSGFLHTAPLALLEASIQAVEEEVPVLLVAQEIAAPVALSDVCPSGVDFAGALLLAPAGDRDRGIASFRFSIQQAPAGWPSLPAALKKDFGDNPGAKLLPLLEAVATRSSDPAPVTLEFPLSTQSRLEVILTAAAPGA